jgi:hypothetical protein
VHPLQVGLGWGLILPERASTLARRINRAKNKGSSFWYLMTLSLLGSSVHGKRHQHARPGLIHQVCLIRLAVGPTP